MKTFLIAALLVNLSSVAFAQEETAKLPEVSTSTMSYKADEPVEKPKASRVTPEFSVISSTFVGSDAQSAKSITKVSLGATIDIGEKNLVTETGVFYRQIGANESVNTNTKSFSAETDLNYLTVPVSEKYYFSNQKESSFFAKAGLAPSLLVGNQLVETTHGTNIRGEDPRAFALDALVGLGGKYQLTEDIGIVLEVSYWRGLTSVYSGNSVFTSNFVNTIGFNINM